MSKPTLPAVPRPLVLLVLLALLVLPSVLAPPPARAAASAEMPMLTVTGAIAADKVNRAPSDEFADAYFDHAGIRFAKAHAFTRQALSKLGMQRMRTRYPNWPAAVTFEGPRLRDVLKAAGATGTTVKVQALDGYTQEFKLADLQGDKVILALAADGLPLAIGGRGPAWLIFPPGTIPGLDGTTDAGLVWAVYLIEVQ